jgi:hypothetical protein
MALYNEEEILEKVKGLIELMYEKPTQDSIQYQSYIFKIILYELFMDANKRHEKQINSLHNLYDSYLS